MIAGLPVGTLAPTFALPALSGDLVSLDRLKELHRPLILIFSDPDCVPCTALMPELASLEKKHVAALTMAVVTRGTKAVNSKKLGRLGLAHVLMQSDREVAESYRALATPSAVLIEVNGLIAHPLAMGSQEIVALISAALDEANAGNYKNDLKSVVENVLE